MKFARRGAVRARAAAAPPPIRATRHTKARATSRRTSSTLEIDQCTPDKNISKDELLRRGADYYQRGEVLYLQGDYRGAVKELVESYCEVPFYSILKDIGQAYERELEYGRAIAYFSRYVLDVPADAKRRARARRIAGGQAERPRAHPGAREVAGEDPGPGHAERRPRQDRPGLGGQGARQLRRRARRAGWPVSARRRARRLSHDERDIHPEIGKPYTYFETLAPTRALKIRTVPGDARIFEGEGGSTSASSRPASTRPTRRAASTRCRSRPRIA